jgi:hypothetical protein
MTESISEDSVPGIFLVGRSSLLLLVRRFVGSSQRKQCVIGGMFASSIMHPGQV